MPPRPAIHLAFEQFFTPLVSDAMDRLGITSTVLPHTIQSINQHQAHTVVGTAFPCRVLPTTEYVEITTLLQMVDAIPANAFVAVAADDDIDAALWGGLMSTRAKARGAVAAVVNGGVRDCEQIERLSFQVFGKYRCVKDIRRRGAMIDFDIPVKMDGIEITPGDLIMADENGVLILPKDKIQLIYEEASRGLSGEQRTALGLADGESARDLFEQFKTF